MFNDVLLTGQFKILLDNKGRMFMPAKTGVEGNEKVILKKDTFHDITCLRLISYRTVLKKVEMLELKMNSCSDVEEYNKYKNLIEEYCLEFEEIIHIDSIHRMVLPKEITDSVGFPQPSILYGTGLGSSLILTKNPVK